MRNALIGPHLHALLDSDANDEIVTVRVEITRPVSYPEFPAEKAARENHKTEVAEALEITRVRHDHLLEEVERAATEHGKEPSVIVTAKYVFAALPARIAGDLVKFPDVVSIELAERWAPGPPKEPVTPSR